MARDVSDQVTFSSPSSPSRSTRSRTRNRQTEHTEPAHSEPPLDDSPFNMKTTGLETFLLDSNESFNAHMAADLTAMSESPVRSKSSRRQTSPDKSSKPTTFVFRQPKAKAVESTIDELPEPPAEPTPVPASASTSQDEKPAFLPSRRSADRRRLEKLLAKSGSTTAAETNPTDDDTATPTVTSPDSPVEGATPATSDVPAPVKPESVIAASEAPEAPPAPSGRSRISRSTAPFRLRKLSQTSTSSTPPNVDVPEAVHEESPSSLATSRSSSEQDAATPEKELVAETKPQPEATEVPAPVKLGNSASETMLKRPQIFPPPGPLHIRKPSKTLTVSGPAPSDAPIIPHHKPTSSNEANVIINSERANGVAEAAVQPTRKILKLRAPSMKKTKEVRKSPETSEASSAPVAAAAPASAILPTRSTSEDIAAINPSLPPTSTPNDVMPTTDPKPELVRSEEPVPNAQPISSSPEEVPQEQPAFSAATDREEPSGNQEEISSASGETPAETKEVLVEKVIEPPPRVAAHAPKRMRVVSITKLSAPVQPKPKRSRPDATDENKPQPKVDEGEKKAKRVKVDAPPKPTLSKSAIGKGHPSKSARPAVRVTSKAYTAPTAAASAKRVPLGECKQRNVSAKVVVPEKHAIQATVPHAFTFESTHRLDLKKAQQAEKQTPLAVKPVLQVFKPAHHPATMAQPTAASLNRALATIAASASEKVNHPPAAKPSTLAPNAAQFKPTVPHAPKFATDERMKERLAFDDLIRRKEEEKRVAEEAARIEEEKRKEEEVKQLRRLLDENARANPVPEWYKERPKKVEMVE